MQRIAPIVLVMSILLGIAGCSALTPAKTPAQPKAATPTPVPTPAAAAKTSYRVERGEVIREGKMQGRVSPIEQRELFFRTSGRVRKVYVLANAQVKTGQILADLENENLQRELATVKLDLERTQVRADTAEKARQNSLKRAEASLEIARIALEAARAQDPTPRTVQAQADLEKVELNLKKAQADYDAIKWRGDAAASGQAAALQQATLNYSQARAAYDLAMQAIAAREYDLRTKEQQVRVAEINLKELQDQGPDPLLKNDVDRALLNVQKLEAALMDTQIISPLDGELQSMTASEGMAVEAFKPMMVAADPTKLEVSTNGSTNLLNELQVGMSVTVKLANSSKDTVLVGAIRRLPYVSTFTDQKGNKIEDRDQSIRITLVSGPEDVMKKLRIGDVTEATVRLQRREDTLWVPPETVRVFQDRRFVVVQEGAVQRRVNVKIGIEGEDRVEILEGLTEGQIVLVP